ncbi:MAG: trypsin-like peptidase domain-containing protein [Aggregatilineales bacterium]
MLSKRAKIAKLTALLLCVSVILVVNMSNAQIISEDFDLDRIQRATVYIIQTRNDTDDSITCVGSGSIVSRDGLILTNAHNTVPNRNCAGEEIIIALTTRAGTPPIASYRASVVQADEGLDIALLQIDRNLDGRRIEQGTLALPFVELADSSQITLDSSLIVLGYPDINGSPVEIRRSVVNGFVTEPSAPDRAWIKVETPDEDLGISGTMTGGGVYNVAGQLVGIPTTAPVISTISDDSCVTIQDTNGDGLVNRTDICVPVGGFINALRPSNFASPLIRAASIGVAVEKLSDTNLISTVAGQPAFNRLYFSTAVNEGMPTRVVNNLPANPGSLFLFFDYENMTPETIYELRVTVDGRPNARFSLAPVRWSGGERGLWYIGSNEQSWINGFYEFTLFINGLASGSNSILIGGSPANDPSFSNILFGISDSGNFFGTGYVLPTGNQVTARFLFQNMNPDVRWTQIWHFNDLEISRQDEESWSEGENGSRSITLLAENGLVPGRYRLDLYINDALAATSDFTVAGAAGGPVPRVFTNIRFVTAASPADALNAVDLPNFPNTVRDIYALFDWEQISPGTLWTMRWLVDDQTFYEETLPWSNQNGGQNFMVRLRSAEGIPDGEYRLELQINSVPLLFDNVVVGIGQLPIDFFAQAEGIQLGGQIVDADTQQGIPGVTFILISEEFSVEDFTWLATQVYSLAVTDRNGRFQLDRPLQFDAPYSVMISAQGYLPISADGVVVDEDTPNPLEIQIPLTRD